MHPGHPYSILEIPTKTQRQKIHQGTNRTPIAFKRSSSLVDRDCDLHDAPISATDTMLLHKEKHVKYWLRCIRTPLPHQYTSNDSNRMTLAFFIISALDLLGVLFERTTQAERTDYVDWIYRCQHPQGGFRGFPATDFDARSTDQNAVWDPANIPATYFALATLCVLGDDLTRVKRRECLQWLRNMQRPDGSFGETLGPDGMVAGGTDARFGYCAMATRWMLRDGATGKVEGVPDVDIEEFVACVKRSEVKAFSLVASWLPRGACRVEQS